MLAFNGNVIDFTGNSQIAKHFKAAIAKIESSKLRFPIIIEFTPDHVIENKENPGQRELSAGHSCRFEQVYRSKDFDGTVVYYNATTPDRRNPGHFQYKPRWCTFTGTEVIEEKDRDYLIFMLFVNPHIVLIPELKEYQNEHRRRSHYALENKMREAESVARIRGLIAKVDIMLGGGEVGIEPNKLRQIALGYNISMAQDEKFSIFEIGNQLRDQVITKTNNRYNLKKIEQFLDDVNFGDRIQMRIMIQKAMDQNLISYTKEPQKQGFWHLIEVVEADGQKLHKSGETITIVPANRSSAQQAFNYLLNYYLSNEKPYEALVDLIE